MKIAKILLVLLTLVACGVVMYSFKPETRKTDEQKASISPADLDKFSHENINYQMDPPPPGADDDKIFGDIADIVRRGELIVLTRRKGNTPLFQMKTDKGYIGEDIEFAKSIADSLGVKLTMRMIYETCDDIVDAIAANKGDIGISKISYTDERSAKVLYTDPYVTSDLCVLVNRMAMKKLGVHTLDELFANKDALIAGHKDTSYEYNARQFSTNAKVVSEADWDEIIKKLRSNKYSATVRDTVVINLLLYEHPRYCLELLPIALKDHADSYAAVVHSKNASLCEWVNRHLNIKLKEQPQINNLIHKYSGYSK
jgi:ABC-type amino acid transport substrate-binding protein